MTSEHDLNRRFWTGAKQEEGMVPGESLRLKHGTGHVDRKKEDSRRA